MTTIKLWSWSSFSLLLQLQFLYLRRCASLSDAGERHHHHHQNHCHHHHHHHQNDCYHHNHDANDEGLRAIASYCLLLRELSVSDCPNVSDNGLAELGRLGPSLRWWWWWSKIWWWWLSHQDDGNINHSNDGHDYSFGRLLFSGQMIIIVLSGTSQWPSATS